MTWKRGRQLTTLQTEENSIQYKYDSDSIRTSKIVDGVVHTYEYLNGLLMHETRGEQAYDYYYDANGQLYAVSYKLSETDSKKVYYFTHNWRGDIVGIYNGNGDLKATYEYDAWGNVTAIEDADGNAITSATHIANLNPFRYRGYYMDTETGLYYLLSRYYDPVTHRFLNADGYFQSGRDILDSNMNAYCGNNPVNNVDSTGQFFIAALAVTALVASCAVVLAGCSISATTPEPYNSPDEAARAFSEEMYNSSLYIRHEYSTQIYSKTIDGTTTYNYNTPRSGNPHSVSVGGSIPKGTSVVAYAHTHPNTNFFSDPDMQYANNHSINGYVVGPDLILQRYDVETESITELGAISPLELTEAQRSALVSEFQVSWDNHVDVGCEFGCAEMEWPTP